MKPSADKWTRVYLAHARALAALSQCARLRVGAVIVSEDYRHVYGQGFNGRAAGEPGECPGEHPCGCLHAEDNAVINCAAPPGEALRVYLTHSPCIVCARRLINLRGVREVIYAAPFTGVSGSGLPLLSRAGVRLQLGF